MIDDIIHDEPSDTAVKSKDSGAMLSLTGLKNSLHVTREPNTRSLCHGRGDDTVLTSDGKGIPLDVESVKVPDKTKGPVDVGVPLENTLITEHPDVK